MIQEDNLLALIMGAIILACVPTAVITIFAPTSGPTVYLISFVISLLVLNSQMKKEGEL